MAGEPDGRRRDRRPHRRDRFAGARSPRSCARLGTAIYPQHILEPHVDDGSFADTWGIDTDPAEIIGTGPFTIES